MARDRTTDASGPGKRATRSGRECLPQVTSSAPQLPGPPRTRDAPSARLPAAGPGGARASATGPVPFWGGANRVTGASTRSVRDIDFSPNGPGPVLWCDGMRAGRQTQAGRHRALAPSAALGLGIPPVERHHLGLFSRMAAISFRFWMIMLSRVTISHPGRHLGYPIRVEHIRACDGARFPVPLVDGGFRVAGIGDILGGTAEDLAEPENVSVDVEADLRRPQAHSAAHCDNS